MKTIKNSTDKSKEISKKEGDDKIAKKVTKNKENSENKTVIILASIFVGLVVIITTVFILTMVFTKSDQTEIPDVTGYSETEAIKALQEAGFVVKDEKFEEPSETIKKGDVTKTSPSAGTIRKEGYEVTLYISLGDTKVTIEDYTNLEYSKVHDELQALGIVVNQGYKEFSAEEAEDYQEGIIIDQSIEPGEKLQAGKSITLYVPKFDNKYPDFVAEGYTYEAIQEFAEKYGLKLKPKYKETTEYAEGTIIDQDRKAGTKIVNGATLTITIAQPPVGDNTGSENEESEDLG